MGNKIQEYIKQWEQRCYQDGIPDESPIEITHLVPDYKKIVMAILKNDKCLKTLGYSRPKCEIYNQLKRIELIQRGKIVDNQLKLKL